MVIGWKKNIAKFESDQYKNGLVSAEFLICQGYSGDIMQGMEENEDIVYVVPKEGTSLASDDMVILRTPAPSISPTRLSTSCTSPRSPRTTPIMSGTSPRIPAAYPLMSEEVRDNPRSSFPPDVVAKCEVIHDLGEDNAKYVAAWDAIKGRALTR